VDLAEEKAPCPLAPQTQYFHGRMPNDTYKKDVDELIPHKERMPWKDLRFQARQNGIRNSTLMALMPAETSAQISNSTNGIEPVRSYITIKQSKDGILKQVVPEYRHLKNKYELLWDQESPEGYLKIMAVLQKYIDQGISVNTSYNPQFYDGEKIPMSEMLQHMVMFYKYGGKQLYYFNTFDGAGEIEDEETPLAAGELDEEDCDSCKI
jgi:ribonucleoside-diphosphate reductase alpha chain